MICESLLSAPRNWPIRPYILRKLRRDKHPVYSLTLGAPLQRESLIYLRFKWAEVC